MIRDYFRNYLWHTCDATLMLGRNPAVKFHSNHDEEDWNVTLAETGENSMTAYRIRLIEKYLGKDEHFLLTYGDGVGNMDIPGSIAHHRRAEKICTITAAHPPGRFGELGLRADSTVIGFNEKPQSEGGYINAGYMVCSRRLFRYLPDDSTMMLEQSPMKKLTADMQLTAFKHTGFWQPMDTFQESCYLNRLWAENKAPWKIW
jgi:glucose-1-phosphate cytidylyltransferase